MKAWSLANKLLAVVLALSLTMTAICGVAGFWVIKSEFLRDQAGLMASSVSERARAQDSIFDDLVRQHRTASDLLQFRLAQLGDSDPTAAFDRYFPRRPGGERRSPDDLFTGRKLKDGDSVQGVVGLTRAGLSLSPADKRILLAAFQVVRELGPARIGGSGSFAFFIVPGAGVIYNPQDVGLLRRDIFGGTGFGNFNTIGLDGDVNGRTLCQGVAFAIGGRPVAGGQLVRRCATPVYVGGRIVGAWTTLVGLEGAAAGAGGGGPDLVVGPGGELIAYLDNDRSAKLTPSMAQAYGRTLGLQRLARAIAAGGKSAGVLDSPDHRSVVAYARLRGTPWRLMTAEPKAPMEARAAWAALAIVGSGTASLLTASFLIFLYARGQIVRPLQRLARHSQQSSAGDETASIDDLKARADEIGYLARQLAAERARAEEAVQLLEDRVAQRTAELERANRAKSSFVANMSHELRTPLNGIVALSDVLARRQSDPKDQATAELVVSSARLLQQVLNDILDISKIEAGQMSLCFECMDLEPTVERIARLHAAAAEAKDKPVALSWRVAPEAAGRYLADEVRLTQILSNLLSNAVKFTAQGEVSLTVDLAPDGVRFIVRDTGVGFPQAMAERLFKRFEQADASTTREYGGTGLGLAICASLCDLMGGSIAAASAPGQGATFTVVLPMRREDSAAPAADAEGEEEMADLRGVRILQAEDHPTNQKITQLSLEPLGVELTTVGNGALAVEAAPRRFDVILMDLHMPVMDGLTAIGLIRAQEASSGSPRTPIVALTADVDREQIRAIRQAGADAHLGKPFRPRELVAVIVHCLEQGRARAAAEKDREARSA